MKWAAKNRVHDNSLNEQIHFLQKLQGYGFLWVQQRIVYVQFGKISERDSD